MSPPADAGGHLQAMTGVAGGIGAGLGFLSAVLVVASLMSYLRYIAFKRLSAAQAPLMAESGAFTARWPPNRMWFAPYAELAAEEARCQALIGILRNRNSAYAPMFSRVSIGDPAVSYQLDRVRQHLAAVQHAKLLAAQREGGPPAPDNRYR